MMKNKLREIEFKHTMSEGIKLLSSTRNEVIVGTIASGMVIGAGVGFGLGVPLVVGAIAMERGLRPSTIKEKED
jgi:adenine/guanine phosphoribosyltransferase-like PRPP-binding protein